MKIELAVPERRAEVEAWLGQGEMGALIKDNRVRSVHHWHGLFIKRFKPDGLLHRLRSWVNDRAFHEYRVLLGLRERGIEAPRPVAWARAQGSTWLFTEEIPGAKSLREVPLTRPLLKDLAVFVRRLHAAGLRDDDLHVGNILLSGGRLFLIDVHRARLFDVLTDADRVDSVAFLLLSLYTFITKTEAERFIRACNVDPRAAWPVFQRMRDRYYRDRQARVRRNGSDFEVDGDLTLRRPFAGTEARRLFEAPPLRMIKELARRRLWLVSTACFVKESPGRSWENAFGLETRGIPTPRLHAVRGDRVLGEWVEGALPLWEHLKQFGVARDLAWNLARVVRRMHFRGVYHRDLKANNILVRGSQVWIIDLDRVDFSESVLREDCVWNLAQLNAAVGAPVSRTDRLRFYFAYAGHDRERRVNWKAWVLEIMRHTIARHHIWPE